MAYALRPRRASLVAMANEKVPIAVACRLAGMDIPEEIYGRSVKVRCPFGEFYHRDGGMEAAFRLYPETNHGYCFVCKASFTPVWLLAQVWGQDSTTVAAELLDRAGIKPATLAQLWAEASRRDEPPDTAMLAAALQTFCARVSDDWDDTQFAPAVAAKLRACLGLLDQVRTPADADLWLAGCKRVMIVILDTRPVASVDSGGMNWSEQ